MSQKGVCIDERRRERERVCICACVRENACMCAHLRCMTIQTVRLLSYFKSKHIRVDFHFSCEEINVIFLNSLFKSLNKKMIS